MEGKCKQTYTVSQNQEGVVEFTLENTSSYPGFSGNACKDVEMCLDPLDTGKDAQFLAQDQIQQIFDPPGAEGQSVKTTNGAANARVVVTFLDYGAKSTLHAVVSYGIWRFDATIIDENGNSGYGIGTTQIPLDSDGDGIADAWELQYGGVSAIGAADDKDARYSASAPLGDGLPALDEYRGFHIIDRSNKTTEKKHIRTSPKKQDLFWFEDKQAVAGHITLFEDQIKSFIELHELLPEATALSNDNVISMVNRNSDGVGTYPIYFTDLDAKRDEDTFGVATGKLKNNGYKIEIRTKPSLSDLEWQYVVAHEAGHRLGLQHTTRKATYTTVTPPTADTLYSVIQVAVDSRRLYWRAKRFACSAGQGTRGEELVPAAGDLLANNKVGPALKDPQYAVGNVYFNTLDQPLVSSTDNGIFIHTIKPKLMDYIITCETDLTKQDFKLLPEDFSKLCIKCTQ